MLEEVTESIEYYNPGPPSCWKDSDTLRYIYEYDWNYNLVCEVNFFKTKFSETEGAFFLARKSPLETALFGSKVSS